MISVVIPARGGSTRIPRKNLAVVCGRTLLQRAINIGHALSSDVIVSSDDEEILAHAREHRARALRRPPRLAGDHVHAIEAVKDAMQYVRNPWIAMLDCSTLWDWETMRDYLAEAGPHPCFAVTAFRGFIYDAHGRPLNRGATRPRTQDMQQYRESGACYVIPRDNTITDQIVPGAQMVVVRWSHSIDTPDDLELAHILDRRAHETRS